MSISDYQTEMLKRTPCVEGLEAFNKCKSRKDVFELIGQPVACDYFLQSIEEGWGPSPKAFESTFRPYINGALTISYKIDDRRVRSQIWCNADEITVDDSIRWLILVGCEGVVKIRNWQVIKIFVDSNSNVEIDCGSDSIVCVKNYGGKVKDIKGNCKFK